MGYRYNPSAPSSRKPVHARLTVVFRQRHLRRDDSGGFQAMKRRIQRALTNAQCVAGHLTDPLLDAPAVIRADGKGIEDQQVQGTLEVVGLSHLPLVWR